MTVSKFEPKERPTNRDLQDQVREVHDCVHAVDGRLGDLTEVVEHHGLQMAALAGALGVQLPTRHELAAGMQPRRIARKLGGLSPWQAAGMAAGVIPAGMALYKVLEPAVAAFALALHHALMGH